MSSDRRSVEGPLQDGVADRSQGYTHNPNPADEVAANRARFEEAQRRLQEDRHKAAEAIRDVQHKLEEQYEAAQHDPDHQRFMDEQIEHTYTDPPHARGGQERAVNDTVDAIPPSNPEAIGFRRPIPTNRRSAEEFNSEE